MEISFFMARLAEDDRNVDVDLEMRDWARFAIPASVECNNSCSFTSSLWGQIMQQLRQGIKLKKVSEDKTPCEFALTPYEMLMDDIRSCKYKLNHVEVHPKKVTTDARDKILEFIRSRPPLKPVADRRMAPRRRKESTAREIVMEEIRDPARGQNTLKKIDRRPSRNNLVEEMKKKRRQGVIAEESPVKTRPRALELRTRRVTLASRPAETRRQTSLSALSLTVREVAHIRAELTKAELEDRNLPLELFTNISEGKTCHVCMTITFGVLNWSYSCYFCNKLVRR